MRYRVYCEEYNYIEKNQFPDKLEKDEWDKHSVHFIIRDRHHEIAATVRLILNSGIGFPIEKHFEFDLNLKSLNRNETAEVSRFIVSKKYRKRHLMFVLIKGIYLYTLDKGIKNIFGVMDDRLFPMLQSVGIPFRKIGKPSIYQGYTFPCLLNSGDLENELHRNNRVLLKYLSNGAIKYNGENQEYTLS